MLKLIVALQTFFVTRLEESKERGATAVEYGMIVALIAAVIVGIVAVLGGKISTAFSTISNAL